MRRNWNPRLTHAVQILTAITVLLQLSCVREAPQPKSQLSQQQAAESVAAKPPESGSDVLTSPQRPWAILYAFAQEGELLRKAALIQKDTVWAGRSVACG